jgi:hypothetical protein
MLESFGRRAMQSPKLPAEVPCRQMNLLFEDSRLGAAVINPFEVVEIHH